MAKLSCTDSDASITTASSSLSTPTLLFKVILPVPKSPEDENLMLSFVTLIWPRIRMKFIKCQNIMLT